MTDPYAGRFVGQSVKRREDARLTTGHGHYVEDVQWPDAWHIAFLRSPVARGTITKLDVSAAAALDGVHAVFTGAEINKHMLSWWQTMGGPDSPQPPRRLLAADDVRYVGDAVVMVLAKNRYIAEDAVDLIDLEIEQQPALISDRRGVAAVAADTELVHPEWGSNVAAAMPYPGMPENNPLLDEALAGAAHVVTETFDQHRYLCVPMETRGLVARWDVNRETMEIVAATQSSHEVRSTCARMLGLSENQVHVLAEDVGGGFGQKMYMTADEFCVVMAAYLIGGAVRWIEDRNENLLVGGHARAESMTLTVGTDAEGHIVGMKAHHTEDVGAFPVPSVGSTAGMASMYVPGPYDVKQFYFTAQAVFTNTCGRCAYRGPWMMETVGREQMIDTVANELGVDPLDFRRRNVIRSDQLPFTTATGATYENVTPAETLEQAAELIGYEAFRKEQEQARRDGRLLGIGLSMYIEPSPGFGILGAEQVTLRIDYGGKVLAFTGSGSHGQSVETTIAQVVADSIGVDVADVRVMQGDTANAPFGSGTGGSRTSWVFGGAARKAGEKMRAKIMQVAASALEASPDDLEIELGVVSVRGVPDAKISLEQVAALAYAGAATLPPDVEPGLEVAHRMRSADWMYSNATHAVTVEVDRDTGAVQILRYVVSEDCGNMINPMVVEGQIAGGVVQGIGGVFFEHFVYDDDGNPLTTTFLDYLLPTAADVPDIEYGHVITPSSSPGGFKPIGEGGAIVSPPALVNAVRDALRPFGAKLTAQPLTPNLLLDIIDGPVRSAEKG